MTKTTITRESMTLAGLTEVYNQYAAKPIKKFTCSKAEAIARVHFVMPAEVAREPAAKKTAAKSSGTSKAGPRTGVCALMTQLFADGLSPKDVFAKIQVTLPEAKTSLKAVYWYRAYLRQQGAQV